MTITTQRRTADCLSGLLLQVGNHLSRLIRKGFNQFAKSFLLAQVLWWVSAIATGMRRPRKAIARFKDQAGRRSSAPRLRKRLDLKGAFFGTKGRTTPKARRAREVSIDDSSMNGKQP